MSIPRIVVVTANAGPQSKSKLLADVIVSRILNRVSGQIIHIEIGTLLADIGPALFRSALTPRGEAAVREIEQADFIVAVTPVYKGSYTGHFKHLFDLVDPDALVGTPVAIAATGGGERHALVVEHQLRPLFAAFQAATLGTGIYVSESDFDGPAIQNPAVNGRLETLAAEAALVINSLSQLLTKKSLEVVAA